VHGAELLAGSLVSVSFCDSGTGYAVGSGGTELRTSDGGKHWVILTNSLLAAAGDDWNEVICLDAAHTGSATVRAASVARVMAARRGAGTTWTLRVSKEGPPPKDVADPLLPLLPTRC
jgi:photosystem II stability/assembly factor-like uncharacterized protein